MMARAKATTPIAPNNCPIRERTGGGVSVGRCWFHCPDGVCPRHGDVKTQLQHYRETGELSEEPATGRRVTPPNRWTSLGELVTDELADLDFRDQYGRKIGVRVIVRVVEEGGGKVVTLAIQPTRDGVWYGATQRAKPIGPVDDPRTQELIQEEIRRRLDQSKKRYAAELAHKKAHGMTRGQRR